MFWRIVISVIGVIAGFVFLIYTKQTVDFVGANNWVEENLGPGQTYTFYKILGFAVIFLSFLYLIGALDSIFLSFVRVFIPAPQQILYYLN